MPITNYFDYMPVAGKAGQLSNYQGYEADTYAAEEVVRYGAAVQLNATGDAITTVKDGGKVIGVALAREGHDYIEKKDDQKYEVGDPVAVVKRGRIFVMAGGEVLNGQSVKVDPATQKFTNDGTVSVANAVFKMNASADQLVEIEINLP